MRKTHIQVYRDFQIFITLKQTLDELQEKNMISKPACDEIMRTYDKVHSS